MNSARNPSSLPVWAQLGFAILVALMLVALTANLAHSEDTGTIQIVRGGNGHGQITSDPAGIDCTITSEGPTGTCVASFVAGTKVKLRARAADDSKFRGWALTSSCRDAPKVEVLAGNLHSCQPVFFLDN